MKTLLFQVFLLMGIVFHSFANNETGLLAELNEANFKMEVYQRQGKMVVVHLANKTNVKKATIQIKDNKGHMIHTEKVAGRKMYVKKFDFSLLKVRKFKVFITMGSNEYETDVTIPEVIPSLKIYQRPHKIIAVQTENTYNQMVTINITNAITGEEIMKKQALSPGKSVSKFDLSKIQAAKINVKVVADGKMTSKNIDL